LPIPATLFYRISSLIAGDFVGIPKVRQGYALTDSPSALAAFTYEKIAEWR
jgi:hypothetical protein